MRDGWALNHHCARVGRPVYKVEAPRFLQEEGVQEVTPTRRELLSAHPRLRQPENVARRPQPWLLHNSPTATYWGTTGADHIMRDA
jgi:hypothetical protein